MADEFDFAGVSDSIGNDLFGNEPADTNEPIESTTPDPIAPVGQVEPVVSEGEPEAIEPETTTEESIAPTGAPKTWRKEALAAWETLPQIVKDEVAKREEDMFKGIETYKQGAQIGDNFRNIITPHMDHLQRAGVNVYEEINGLLEYGKIMRFGTQGERMQLLSTIAQEYNIDLLDLAESTPALPYIDPAVKALQTEINALKSGRQQEETQRSLQVRQENQAKIDAFASDPKHEHFSILEPEMSAFISTGVCKTLDEAYEKALWANPLTRVKEQERLTALTKTQSEARIKAAKTATSANLQTNARPASATTPQGSMDDTMRETLANIRTR